MKLRNDYMIAMGLLMLTAFGGRANAQDQDCYSDQGFGPASGSDQNFYINEGTWSSRDCFTNPNYTYLTFQIDGNLVLYANEEQKALWASNTNYTADGGPEAVPAQVFALQVDTNAVIYNDDDNPIWASGTDQYNNAYLEVLDGYWGIWFTDAWRNVRRYP